MSEVEATAMLAAIGDTVCSFTALWVSVTFAYLSVAYFVGGNLSRFQNLAVSGLYLASALLFGIGALAHTQSWCELEAKYSTSYRRFFLADVVPFYTPSMAVFFVVGLCVSFYFMYNVRRTAQRSVAA